MELTSYYDEKKYCTHCRDYVRYLMSVQQSFCAECGHAVKLFDERDRQRFFDALEKKKHRAS